MGRFVPYFDGTSTYITLPSKLDYSNGITIVAKCITTSTSNFLAILDDMNGSYANTGINITKRSSGIFKAAMYLGGTWKYGDSPNANNAQVYHVATVWDKSTIKTYLNGVSGTAAACAGSIALPTFTPVIGAYANTYNYKFNGILFDIEVWNYARTQKEIVRDMYKTLKGNETGLVGYWKLDEGGGTVAYDSCLRTAGACTWSPTVKGSSVTLSNDNLSASLSTYINNNAVATTGRSSGKYYFEVTMNIPSANGPAVGVTDMFSGALSSYSNPNIISYS